MPMDVPKRPVQPWLATLCQIVVLPARIQPVQIMSELFTMHQPGCRLTTGALQVTEQYRALPMGPR